MLVGTDVCVQLVFLTGREPECPEETHLSDLVTTMTISHAEAGYRTWVAAVRWECVNTVPARQLID